MSEIEQKSGSDLSVLAEHQRHMQYFSEHGMSEHPYMMRTDGERPGPHVVLCGGIHGTESGGVEAMMAIHEAIVEGRSRLKCGSISYILGNPDAYGRNVRLVDENMGRVFTMTNPGGSIESERATQIMAYIISSIRDDVSKAALRGIIDIHSLSADDMQAIVYNRKAMQLGQITEILPKSFDFYMEYERSHIKGMLADFAVILNELMRTNIQSITMECGKHDSINASLRAIYYVRKLLEYFGVEMDGKFDIDSSLVREKSIIPVFAVTQSIVPEKGFAFDRPRVGTGWKIDPGQIFASTAKGLCRAPVYGEGSSYAGKPSYVVMPDNTPSEKDTDAGFVAVVKDTVK